MGFGKTHSSYARLGCDRLTHICTPVRLTPAEVEKLIAAAKLGRHGQRDATLILVAFRHGLRAVEIADLEWSQIEWGRNPALHVRRAKSGKPAVHPIRGDELRMLRELQRNTTGAFVFETERGGPFTADAVKYHAMSAFVGKADIGDRPSGMCAYGEMFQFSVEAQGFFKKRRVTDALVP
jgi:integrase